MARTAPLFARSTALSRSAIPLRDSSVRYPGRRVVRAEKNSENLPGRVATADRPVPDCKRYGTPPSAVEPVLLLGQNAYESSVGSSQRVGLLLLQW